MDPHSKDLTAIWPQLSAYVLDREAALASLPAIGNADPSPFNGELPAKGTGTQAAFDLFKASIASRLSTSCGPRYFGFITGGASPAAHIGDVLATSFDQNVMTASESAGSAAADIEEAVVGMIRDLLDLPKEYSGILTAGGTSSNTLALAIARQWVGRRAGVDIGEDGLQALGARRIRVFGTMAHQSISKATSTLGLGRSVVHVAPIAGSTTHMDPMALDKALAAAATTPELVAGCVVVIQSGEVNTSNCDSINGIAAVCKRRGAWLHIDGAANLLARASPTHAALLDGLELADSITGDCHKWFNVPYDCGVMLSRHPDAHAAAMTATAPYLGAVPSFAPINLSLDNSRRFRALPLWMALQAYGRKGFAEIVDRTCRFAAALGAWVDASANYELLQPVCLNTVLFRVIAVDVAQDRTKAVLSRVNASGKVFMTGTVWAGRPAIRAAIANWRTTEDDLQIVTDALVAAANQ
ncbi:hypothetical protein HDU87_006734 [Geranomyces variabilis]|uniref:Uncharacterized protein n=1 Tax=Geranomyces variabilis TaxID=109894 RepID=A0AAD5TPP7_9FUNG|nr:hypothetical protein HDU87_006734 [Geranomyces variabilis]